MREIKFRAWDREAKEMKSAMSFFTACGYFWACHENGENLGRYQLLQYTGLKDKNGKEIYEGDIVRERWSTSENVGEMKISPTKGTVSCVADSLTGEEIRRPVWYEHQMEIIGNIYETPNLLTNEK